MIYENIMAFTSKIYCFSSFVNNAQGFPKPLSKEEELELIKKARAGDKSARDKVISHNLRLVVHIVKKFGNSLEADDLISVGTIGLIKAVDTFDYTKGAQLSTYASRCISNEILMLIRANKRHKDVISLNSVCNTSHDGAEIELEDIVPANDKEVYDQVEQSCLIDKAKLAIESELSDVEKDVIYKRYGLENDDGMTQREVAQGLGISRSYVSRIESKALKTIRKTLDPEFE